MIAPPHENNVDHSKVTRTTVSPMNPAAVAAVEPGHNHPHPPPPRMMSVAIPTNVVAGQQLRVRTPDGNFLDVRGRRFFCVCIYLVTNFFCEL